MFGTAEMNDEGHSEDESKYPLHFAAYLCDMPSARKLLKDPSMAEQSNLIPSNQTVLHCCAAGGRANSHNMAKLLLDSLPYGSDRRQIANYVNKLDKDGNSALYYAVETSHASLVEFLLKLGFIPSPTSSQQDSDSKTQSALSLTHLAVKRKGAAVLKLLIEYGFPVSGYEEGQTPLHLCVQQPESKKTVECLKILVNVYTLRELKLRREMDGAGKKCEKTALHLAAESCNPLILAALLEHPGPLNLLLNVSETETPIKTAMDLVVESYNSTNLCKKKNSVECLRLLMLARTNQEDNVIRESFCKWFGANQPEKVKSPLDCALKIRATKMVEIIVTSLPDGDPKQWMDDTNKSGKNYLSKLYERTPAALPALMNQCLKTSEDGEKVHDDISVIKGYLQTSPTSSVANIETRYLRILLDHPNKKAQKAVLVHPLVKHFLKEKQRKLKWFNLTSVLLQAIWLILYNGIVGSKYDTYDSSCHTNDTSSIFSGACASDSPTSREFGVLIIVFLILNVLINLKEAVQLNNDGLKYFCQCLNWFQFINFVVAHIVGIVGLSVKPPLPFLVLAAFGFLLGCILFLREFVKFDWCGIFIFVVGKVIRRTASLMLIFLPILIGFRQNLKILLPAMKSQLEGNFQGLVKVLVVMTGEYQYDGIFEESQPNNYFAVFSSVGFIVSVIIGLALLNILMALAVDDVSSLMTDAQFRMSAMRVRQIYHWEKFLDGVLELTGLNLGRYIFHKDEKSTNDGDPKSCTEECFSLLGLRKKKHVHKTNV